MSSEELCFMSARDLADLLQAGELSAREVMAAHLEQIARLNPSLNAIVAKLDDDECLALARAADDRGAQYRRARRQTGGTGSTATAATAGGGAPKPLGPLHGLPIAFKDQQEAVGFPCTWGSPLFRDFRPYKDSPLVARLRAAGAIPIGKTNMAELGMGSHTYNNVYGTTFNPYDPTKSAGGSSGGAGAALASGMLPIADGGDMGGSIRNPASFNNVVGLRPSAELMPTAPDPLPGPGFGVGGPLARTVADVGFFLSAMAEGSVGARRQGGAAGAAVFRGPLEHDFTGARIAWAPDLGGLPLEPEVRAVLAARRQTFEGLGCVVEDACPDLSAAEEVFLTIRRFRSAAAYGPLLAEHREMFKPEAIAEIRAGRRLTGADVGWARSEHRRLLDAMSSFEEQYDFLVCTVSQVAPFDATLDWPKAIDGVEMTHYIQWMQSAYWISTTLRPALAVPAGSTTRVLPVGIQIVGRPGADLDLLRLGHAFEQATGFGARRPPIAAPAGDETVA